MVVVRRTEWFMSRAQLQDALNAKAAFASVVCGGGVRRIEPGDLAHHLEEISSILVTSEDKKKQKRLRSKNCFIAELWESEYEQVVLLVEGSPFPRIGPEEHEIPCLERLLTTLQRSPGRHDGKPGEC
jgi:hypothetical protein